MARERRGVGGADAAGGAAAGGSHPEWCIVGARVLSVRSGLGVYDELEFCENFTLFHHGGVKF